MTLSQGWTLLIYGASPWMSIVVGCLAVAAYFVHKRAGRVRSPKFALGIALVCFGLGLEDVWWYWWQWSGAAGFESSWMLAYKPHLSLLAITAIAGYLLHTESFQSSLDWPVTWQRLLAGAFALSGLGVAAAWWLNH